MSEVISKLLSKVMELNEIELNKALRGDADLMEKIYDEVVAHKSKEVELSFDDSYGIDKYDYLMVIDRLERLKVISLDEDKAHEGMNSVDLPYLLNKEKAIEELFL